MFNLIKRLPGWLIILVGIFFAYGNTIGTEYIIKWKYIWPFVFIIFGIWKIKNKDKIVKEEEKKEKELEKKIIKIIKKINNKKENE